MFTQCWTVVLTCVSNGGDVSSEGQPGEGNGHCQNRGLLVARQGGGGLVKSRAGPLFCVVWMLSAAFKEEAGDLMGRTDGGHVMCDR